MTEKAENRDTILFIITPKKMKYGICLTKHVQDLYVENFQNADERSQKKI